MLINVDYRHADVECRIKCTGNGCCLLCIAFSIQGVGLLFVLISFAFVGALLSILVATVVVALICLSNPINGGSLAGIILQCIHNFDHSIWIRLPVGLPVGGEEIWTIGESVDITAHTWPVLL